MSTLTVVNQPAEHTDTYRRDPYFEGAPSKCDATRYKIYSIEDAKRLFRGRDVYIWGAGQKGRGFLLALRRCGFEAKGFLDSNPQMVGTEYMGVRVYHPDQTLKVPDAGEKVFVLTATVDLKNKEIFATLEQEYGFVRGRSFENIQALSPLYPTIEVTGLCNLRCSSCPRSDASMLENGKFMSYANYERVIHKLVREIPFVYLVDLYMWGEPLLNPEIADVIRLNNSLGIASGLSTNLNNVRNLEAAMEAYPAQIRVSLSGMSKETYEVTHTGGKWDQVSKNMEFLSKVNEKFGNRTIVELYFHLYQHNLHEVPAIVELCKRYNFRFHPSLAILLHDFPLAYLETGRLPESAQAAKDRLLIDLDTLIDDCEKQTDRNCILTRVAPVINWDMSVMPCCTFAYTGIARSYLEISLADLLDRRTYSSTCASCQKHALHRWNDQGYYSGYVQNVVKNAVAQA